MAVSLYIRNSTKAHEAMSYHFTPTAPPAEGHYQFKFVAPDADVGPLDAIIIGSGSGGGVAAKTLAEAGMRVLVLEKGWHFDPAGQAYTETQAIDLMYDGAMFSTNDYGDVALVSGSVFGGGSTVNWAACLQPPRSVRDDWAAKNLPYFKSAQFQDDLDAVCAVMGVSPPTSQNEQNKLLLEGARRLGYQHAEVPQNNGGGAHGCNHDCANSCRSGGKKGGVHSWLIDAARAGAKFMTGVSVRRIIFTPDRVAEGVVIRLADGRERTLTAPRVLVCAGSIHSPAVLQRSKVPNPRIGTTLYVHPTNFIYGIFPHATHPTDGQILTSVVGEFANLTPSGHGVRIETGCMQPTLSMSLLQWAGGAEHKVRIAKHPHMAGFIAIARDRTPGRVVLDAHGEPLIHYTVSNEDRDAVVQGTIAAAECLRVVGAQEIIVAGRGVRPWRTGDDFDAWVRQVKRNPPAAYGSAHQMASNAMGARSGAGVCDPAGAVYGVKGVWCADASVLPSASGVNPMVSTMAVSLMVARGVVDEWRAGAAASARL